MRDDNRGYEYNIDVSRTLAQRGGGSMAQVGASMAQYPQDMHLLSSGAMPASYRGNGYASMGTKNYYSMGGDWADAYGADGTVDYGLSCPPYSVISNDMVPGYNHWTGGRHKTTNQGSSVYLDSDPGYGYGTTSTANLVHRPAVSVSGADSSAYSFSSIAASLPSTGSERLLPTPVSRTLSTSIAGYRSDGLPAAYGSAKSSHNSAISNGAAGQASPVSPISDVTAAAAVAGYASSAYDYATTMRASQHHGSGSSDAYATVSSGGSETIFGDSDRSAATQGSGVDLTGYTYGGGSPTDTSSMRRASSGSGLTSRSAADSSASSTSYVGSDGGAPAVHGSGPYHHTSSSTHGHHPHNHSHHHQTSSHHASPRHGSQHHLSQQQHAVTGVTAYGELSGSNNASSGVSGTTAVVDSHRTALPSRR